MTKASAKASVVEKVRFDAAVCRLHQATQEFKQAEKSFTDEKKLCTDVISRYFDERKIDECMVAGARTKRLSGCEALTVKLQQKTSIVFDAEKLERVLGKEMSAAVIEKEYRVADMVGLVEYLKSCGVDPKVFRSYICVTKTVNKDELERLEELGKIDIEDIRKCCSVEARSKPYYTIKAGKEHDE